ncbi:alpha/beta hydrolase [Xanthocytophaga flava]|uniref:alpha/beta hydrolase n=1 Tax=Xanthocytophaga flava TaxID=3048013 RepID=UPI0028D7A3EE|nr:alpha/beta hydrolase [Xanthocytophaga flavus]MDJ1473534.1 alpha/beta hydrolase [Xanthocytophaga flavus]
MIYLFSGLGADHRVFQFLDLKDYPTKTIEWVLPFPSETLELYAQRLIHEQIQQKDNLILIGVSFGGIVATEVAKILKPRRVILISSVKNKHELPIYYRWIGMLQLDRWIPARWLLTPTLLTYYSFGVRSKQEIDLLNDILRNTDPIFLKWAIRQILTWQSIQKIENLVHIHGDKDRILPYKYTRNTIPIHAGGHLMIIRQVTQINAFISKLI